MLIVATGLLLSGCAGSQVTKRPATAETHTVARATTTGAVDGVSEGAGKSEPVIEQVAMWQPASTVSTPAPLPSADGETQTLDSLERLALSNNPTLVQLQARVDAANGRWVQVGLYPNPEIAYSAPEIGNSGTPGQQGAYLQQEFVTADKLSLNRNAATWDVKRSEQELAAQRLRVLTDVRRGFYSVRIAQERVNIAVELQSIAQAAVEKAKELVKLQEPQTVLTQAEIEAELADVLVENSQAQLDGQWRNLAAVIGRPEMPVQGVAGDLTSDGPQLVWEQTLDRIHRESPELAAAAAEVEQARWALQVASVQAVPNVTVQAGAMYDYGTRDPIATLQIQLPIPIYDRNQGGIAEAHSNVLAAEKSVQRMQLSLQQRLAAVYQQYEQARQQAVRYDGTILKKAKTNLDLNRQAFEAGESAYLAVLTAQRSYSQARLTWLNAVEQLWSATVQMEGLLLSDSLD
tara:strand:- start:741 stop:2126 length:1386 start_codon:yes stop_codon:yes gene_type:complete